MIISADIPRDERNTLRISSFEDYHMSSHVPARDLH